MKISFTLFMLVLAFVLGPCRSSGQTAAPPFSIAISTDTPAVKVGADLSLKVHITNTSDHDINVSSSYFEGTDASYRQDVRDGRGNLPRRAVREMSTRTSGHWIRHTLKPGQSVDTVTSISPEYDLSRAGEYTVQLSRPVSDDPKDGLVKSNKVTITVIP